MVNEADVIAWLRHQSDKDFFEFVYKAAEGRGPDASDPSWLEAHVVVGHACREKNDPKGAWWIELVSLPAANASVSSEGRFCEAGSHCGHELVSWAKRIRCPPCGNETAAT